MGVVKNLLRGFRGGPNFSETNNFNASFENIQFSVRLPYSNVNTKEPPRPIHFSFLKEDWFEENSKKINQNNYVHVDTQLWYYVPLVGLPNAELGVLSLTTQLRKVPHSSISAFNLNELGKHIVTEYEEYHNAPINKDQEDSFKGWNTRIRQEVIDYSNSRNEPWSQEQIDRETQLRLTDIGYAPLSPHQIKTIKNRPWVFYIEQKAKARPTKDRVYCTPLSDKYYLCMSFGYRVDCSDKFHLWKDHAEAAEKRIMESVKLTFPNDERALPSS
ncbi:hypothetical protein [Litoribacillus peritrichatus]|uniref:Uncharacterized protein n=1 Tax=Litoribacillus peritrichatus TaxID=718191 RepID=A0ABP7MRA4_9GAMM